MKLLQTDNTSFSVTISDNKVCQNNENILQNSINNIQHCKCESSSVSEMKDCIEYRL